MLILLIVALQIPAVQTMFAKKAGSYLEKQTGYPISIKSVKINWWDNASLEGIQILDLHDSTMIKLDRAKVDFTFSSFFDDPILIDAIDGYGAIVHLIKYQDGEMNLNKFIKKIKSLGKKNKKKKKAFKIGIITLNKGLFMYDDMTKPEMVDPNRFDHNHFDFDNIYAETNNLYILKDTFKIDVQRLDFVERNINFPVENLHAHMHLNKRFMEFDSIKANMGQSYVTEYLKFEYDTIRDMSDFNNKINIVSRLKNTKLYSKDLAIVAPGLRGTNDVALISGSVNGIVKDFKITYADINFGKGNHLKGTLAFEGLPDYKNMDMNLSFKNSSITPAGLKPYLSKENYERIKKLGKTRFDASFRAFIYDYVVKGDFKTQIGRIIPDIRLSKAGKGTPRYSGGLELENFQVDKAFDRPQLGLLSMKGKIDWVGNSVSDAALESEADISLLEYRGYGYSNIKFSGKLKQQFFDGFLGINDRNLVFTAKGRVDLSQKPDRFDLAYNLEKAYPRALKILPDSSFIKSSGRLKLQGVLEDNIEGIGKLNKSQFYYKGKHLDIDSLRIAAVETDSGKIFKLRSPFADIDMNGQFKFKDLAIGISHCIKEYKLTVLNNEQQTNSYFSQKVRPRPFDIDFEIDSKDISPILDLVQSKVNFSKNFSIKGKFSYNDSMVFNAYSHIDTIFTPGIKLIDDSIFVISQKPSDNLSGNIYLNAFSRYGIKKNKKLFSFKNHISVEKIGDTTIAEIKAQKLPYFGDVDLTAHIQQKPNVSTIQFDSTSLNYLNNSWAVNDNNQLQVISGGQEIIANNFILSKDGQKITIDGKIGKNTNDQFLIDFENFSMAQLTPFTKAKFDGIINGNIQWYSVMNSPSLSGNLSIAELGVEGQIVGDAGVSLQWDKEKNVFNINGNIQSRSGTPVSLTGYYLPGKTEKSLNLTANFRNMELITIQPFLQGQATEMEGLVNGTILISGTPKHFKLNGTTDVNSGKFKVAYLNTKYAFEGPLNFDYEGIKFNNLKLQDSLLYNNISRDGHFAIANGTLKHDAFKDFNLNMTLEVDNCMLLDTKKGMNSLFYGRGYGTGSIKMYGPFDGLKIDSKLLTVENGGEITILAQESGEVEEEEWIQWVEPLDPTPQDSIPEHLLTDDSTSLNSNVRMDITFDVQEDNQINFIYGDEVFNIVRGLGQMQLIADTKDDEFNMFGQYKIMEGYYDFTFFNVKLRKFTAQPGGTISFNGDPLEGIIDITAEYEQRVPLAPIFDTTLVDRNSPELKRRYPVAVEMYIKGIAVNPTITFSIDFREYPSFFPSKDGTYPVRTDEQLYVFKNLIESDEQEMNRQVFSLVVLKRLSPANEFETGGVAGNLTDIISNQFGSFLSQLNDNIDVGLDVAGNDSEALRNLNLRLSVSALGGRARITREGTGAVTGAETGTTDASSVIGDVTIEYYLTKDGRLRLKAYNRNNPTNIANSVANPNNQLYGASLFYTKSANRFWDLFKFGKGDKKRKRQRNAKAIEQSVISENDEEKEQKKEEDSNSDEGINKEAIDPEEKSEEEKDDSAESQNQRNDK